MEHESKKNTEKPDPKQADQDEFRLGPENHRYKELHKIRDYDFKLLRDIDGRI